MKIATILGARPQFIKAAAVSRIVHQYPEIEEIIIHTGQHFDKNMSAIFFEQMGLPQPHYNLGINSLHHGAMTGQMLEKIEEALLKENPDLVMVYGDTNSTLAGSLAAKKLNIKIAHIEAGLRSFNMKMPEEVNRIVTDRLSDYLFCPTETAVKNLHQEGFEHFQSIVANVGDVMYDATLYYSSFSNKKSTIIADLKLKKSGYIVCTIHRQENTDDPERVRKIIQALNVISRQSRIVLPIHPRTRKILQQQNLALDIETIDPVGYFDMIELLKNCSLVMTDSGGMQKEAYFFNKFCITLRDETEWIELVDNQVNFLAGPDFDSIENLYSKIKNETFKSKGYLYGNGNAAEKIITALKRNL